jgi:hypothetical protein
METYTAYAHPCADFLTAIDIFSLNRHGADGFYQVERPVLPTTVDLEHNNHSDDDAASQHKNSSHKEFAPL